jgi:hypothetical protein
MSATEKHVFIIVAVWFTICASIVLVKSTPASMPEPRHIDASAD